MHPETEKITQKHALSNNEKKTTATTKPWFSRLLRHPARKRNGSILGHNTHTHTHTHIFIHLLTFPEPTRGPLINYSVTEYSLDKLTNFVFFCASEDIKPGILTIFVKTNANTKNNTVKHVYFMSIKFSRFLRFE